MSRTLRRMPADPPRNAADRPRPLRPWEQAACCQVDKQGFQILPDGKTTWIARIRRDSRATGLREHSRHRRDARQELRAPTETAPEPISGKIRRYAATGEAYAL